MNNLGTFFQYLEYAGIGGILDILIVAVVIYQVMKFVRNTAASRVLWGVVILLAIVQFSSIFNLYALHYLTAGIMQFGAIALVVVFQPELRHGLEKLGVSVNFFRSRKVDDEATRLMILHTVEAVTSMAWAKTGALIVFEMGDSLSNIAATGTTVNADMNAELIKNIFFHNAPLHDGAMVVSNGRMQAAGCILPLTARKVEKELGTRHRAAIGVTEGCDCFCIVVSEETGSISFAQGGMLKRHQSPEQLERLLLQQLVGEKDGQQKSFLDKLKGVIGQ